jgi:hypothetical protein
MTSHRRSFLRGVGSLIALPTFASFGFRRFASAAVPTRPKRMVFLAMGWPVTFETWYPDPRQTGAEWTLPDGLKPLARHHRAITVVQNTYHKYSSDGHACSTFWLTGANRFAVPGKVFSNTISVDQAAAAEFGVHTRFDSLACRTSGGEGGHGRAVSWDRQGKPVATVDSPVAVFHKLFSDEKTPLEVRQQAIARQQSVLDTALEDARDFARGLAREDIDKLDEYLESIRDIETRLAKETAWLTVPKQLAAAVSEPHKGVDGKQEITVMYDLIVAALQADSTRVITYAQPVQSLLRSLGLSIDAHNMSHYGPGPRMEASQTRDRAQSELLAHFIDKLKTTKESDGSSLFDHVSVVMGSNVRCGHSMDNCPTLLTGGGAGVKLGHHIVMSDPKTPLCNVWLTLLRGVGVNADSFGDSTGIIEDLVA